MGMVRQAQELQDSPGQLDRMLVYDDGEERYNNRKMPERASKGRILYKDKGGRTDGK